MIKLHNIDFSENIQEKLRAYIKEKEIETSQAGIHFGNFCLVNIPDELMAEIRIKFTEGARGFQYRNAKTIMEAGDLTGYKPGDKVTIEYLSTDFFPVRNEKATVYKADGSGKIILRAYKKQRRGWHIGPGDDCRFKRGW